jgi:hypothetical protein
VTPPAAAAATTSTSAPGPATRRVETDTPAASACAANDAGDVAKLPAMKIKLPEKDMPADRWSSQKKNV